MMSIWQPIHGCRGNLFLRRTGLQWILKTISPLLLVLIVCGTTVAEPFKAMSFNILAEFLEDPFLRWRDPERPRSERVRAIFEQENADLLGLQEVTNGQLPDLIDFLPGFDYVLGQDDQSFYNAVFYRQDRYSLEASGVLPLPGGFHHVVWAQLADSVTDQPFVFASTHLRPGGSTSQATAIQQQMPSILNGLPLVLVGDFNDGPLGDAYRLLRGQSGAPNFTMDDACIPYFCSPFIDYVLHTTDVVTTDARIVTDLVEGLRPSDHSPVTAELDAHPAMFPQVTRQWPQSSYLATDTDFDDLGDQVINGAGLALASIGESDTTSINRLARAVAKFELPALPEAGSLEQATLRFYLSFKSPTPLDGPLSVLHSLTDNDLEQLASDYEDASYADTAFDLLEPTSAVAQFHELDVTDFVNADYQNDGGNPVSAFRLQVDEAIFVEDGQGHTYSLGFPRLSDPSLRPQLVLTFVPEPDSCVLAILALACWLAGGLPRSAVCPGNTSFSA